MTVTGALEECLTAASEEFEVLEARGIETRDGRKVVRAVLGLPRSDFRVSVRKLYKNLIRTGCYPYLYRSDEGLILVIARPPSGGGRGLLALALALATLASVYVSGMALSGGGEGPWSPLAYLVGLLAPLAIHELGHLMGMLYYGVPRSPPFFIPAPPIQLGFLGTFGAVINLRWLPPTSESLAVIGILGPLAGFILALPLAAIGIESSLVVPETSLPEGTIALPVAPLIFAVMGAMKAEPGTAVILSPLAFASYIVLLITFLNLIPIGSLDGGHVIRGLTSEGGHYIATIIAAALGVMVAPFFPPATLFVLIAFTLHILMGGRHPGPSMADGDLSPLSALTALIYGVLVALTLPIPIA